jgi:F1F0 ATPase subunit 2
MTEPLVLAWLAGTVLGAAFFGGLWWTIRRAAASPQPALWFLGSLLLRMGMALAGFYVVGAAHWERLFLCVLGFVMARIGVIWVTRPQATNDPQLGPAAPHAP